MLGRGNLCYEEVYHGANHLYFSLCIVLLLGSISGTILLCILRPPLQLPANFHAGKGEEMNRFKKFELQKQTELTSDEGEEFLALVQAYHRKLFSEEYDFMMDSHVDAGDRCMGINPMNQEYIARIKKKRADLGVCPLEENGMPPLSNDSWRYAHERALEANQERRS